MPPNLQSLDCQREAKQIGHRRNMTELASEYSELLLDGARYGDVEDVLMALNEHRASPDSSDEQGRTGEHKQFKHGLPTAT